MRGILSATARVSIPAFSLLCRSAVAWEFDYGDPNQLETAHRRVTPVIACPGDGYIAIGTQGIAGVFGDAYVVRTDNSGSTLWQTAYDVQFMGRPDEGVAVVEASGGFVFLSNAFDGGVWMPALTHIDCSGNVVWSQVYPDVVTGFDIFGRDLISTQFGNPAYGTAPGDFVVAGEWNQIGFGLQDAFLMRTDANGNLIWNLAYDDGVSEGFNALTEAVAGSSPGDLVAVGRYGWPGGTPVGLVARVSGDNGAMGWPHCLAVHGDPGDRIQEIYYSVTELTVPPFTGEFVMVGVSANVNTGPVNMRVVQGDPCTITAQSYLGGSPLFPTPAIAFDVREVVAPTAPYLQAGDLAIVGAASPPFSTFYTDAALVFVAPGSLAPIVGRLFGGPRDEFFISLAENPPGGSHPPGFVMAGFTDSDWQGAGDQRNAYQVGFDPAVRGCDIRWNPTWTPAPWLETPIQPRERRLANGSWVHTDYQFQWSPWQICR